MGFLGKDSRENTKLLGGDRENAVSRCQAGVPSREAEFLGAVRSKHNKWGHWTIPEQLALPQCRGKSGSIIPEDLLVGCWGVPWQDGIRGKGSFTGAASASHRPGVNYPKKPTISFIKAYKCFIKA